MHFSEPGRHGLTFGCIDPLRGIIARCKGRAKYTPKMNWISIINQNMSNSPKIQISQLPGAKTGRWNEIEMIVLVISKMANFLYVRKCTQARKVFRVIVGL